RPDPVTPVRGAVPHPVAADSATVTDPVGKTPGSCVSRYDGWAPVSVLRAGAQAVRSDGPITTVVVIAVHVGSTCPPIRGFGGVTPGDYRNVGTCPQRVPSPMPPTRSGSVSTTTPGNYSPPCHT